jgi:hypothetical protein
MAKNSDRENVNHQKQEKPTIDDVKNWMKHQGQVFEMEVANNLAKIGFNPSQGRQLLLTSDKKIHEIDIVAYESLATVTDPKQSLLSAFFRKSIGIEFAIECKYNGDKPWIVFKKSRPKKPSKNDCFGNIFSWPYKSEIFELLNRVFTAPSAERNFFLGAPNGTIGYGVTTFKKKNDEVNTGEQSYATLNQIGLIASELLEQNQSFLSSMDKFVIPVVILNGDIYEAELNKKNDLVVKKIYSCCVPWKASAANGGSYIQILTKDSHINYFKNSWKDIRAVEKYLKKFSDYLGLGLDPGFHIHERFWTDEGIPNKEIIELFNKMTGIPSK